MAGRNLSRGFLKARRRERPVHLKAVLRVGLGRLLPNPPLNCFAWDSNGTTNSDDRQLSSSQHREYLRSTEAKQLSDFSGLKQQRFQS
jgi:hypothetical protein